jgi:hypothetical protein
VRLTIGVAGGSGNSACTAVFRVHDWEPQPIMVDQSYMLKKGAPTSLPKRYLDQTVLPVMIDLAGDLEAGLEQVAIATKRHPIVAVGAAVITGAALCTLLLRQLAPRRRFLR